MLINLHVKNLALIEEADVDFDNHLNILTGETGAGKSVLIGSIQSALGSRISRDMIRKGCEDACIELVFHTDRESVRKVLCDNMIPWEEGDIIIQRRLTNRRVINKINGVTVPVSRLKEISPLLLDLSGQHENQLLLHPKNHLQVLDHYQKSLIEPHKVRMKELYRTYQELHRQLLQEKKETEDRTRQIDFLKYEITEINRAGLQDGEDEELEQQYRLISHSKDILETCQRVYALTGEDQGASDLAGKAFRHFSEVAELDGDAETLAAQLETVDNLLNDFNRELADYMSSMEFDEETLHNITERLDLINHLKSKYGDSIEKIRAYRERSLDRYQKLVHFEEYIRRLSDRCIQAKKDMEEEAELLSMLRRQAAAPLCTEIIRALQDLNFCQVRFEISMEKRETCQADGWDEVCFMISTNPGMPLGPLQDIASGGELSRIMLAIKSILAQEDQVETLIFDEIDTGISGRTAQRVSERLGQMGRNRQVIAITHLPQIAAMADSHYLIEKTSDSHSTISSIHKLTEEESVKELARMLGGARITAAVTENAKEMKQLAANMKRQE